MSWRQRLLSGMLDGDKVRLSCVCGERDECTSPVTITKEGAMSRDSGELVQCGNIKAQLQACKRLKTTASSAQDSG